MNRLDQLLDQIESVYHTPAVGVIRMEVADLRRERDALRDERDAIAESKAAAVNAARLMATEKLDAARAEVERLRESLREIAAFNFANHPTEDYENQLGAAVGIARAALAGKDNNGK